MRPDDLEARYDALMRAWYDQHVAATRLLAARRRVLPPAGVASRAEVVDVVGAHARAHGIGGQG